MCTAEQREEAIKRIREMCMPEVVVELLNEGVLCMSYPDGAVRILEESMYHCIKAFERSTGAYVYHVITDSWLGNQRLSMLYVTRDKDLWTLEMQGIKNSHPEAYTVNSDFNPCEMGCIEIKNYASSKRII